MAQHKPKMLRLQRWWNLSKFVTKILVGLILVIFQRNSLTPSPPHPPTLPRSTWQKIDLETLFERNRWFPSVCEVMIKTWGAVLIAAWGIINKFNFLTHKCIYIFASNLNTINLKLFHNHGGIYRFRKKFKKDSEKMNPLGVRRSMRGCILEVYYEGLGWWSTLYLFTILLILTWELR